MSDGAARAVDGLVARAGLDPGAGLQVVGVDRLASVAFDPSMPLIVLAVRGRGPAASGVASADGEAGAPVLPGRHARGGARDVLAALYPGSHRLVRLSDAGRSDEPLETLDDGELAGHDWLVPALDPIDNIASPHGMAAVSARLRAPDGCPWDRRQDHMTLRPYLLEEAYETLDAIEHGTPADLAEELGDLLLQVILHAQFAAEERSFDLTDVYRSIAGKIVRRHPHVFGGLEVDGVEVMSNWESIKAGERAERGKPEQGAFAGVARALPALAASREIQERAAALGWDWEAIEPVWEKVAEEMAELREAGSDEEQLHELGDVLFALVNVARWMTVDPEEALRAANHRWVARHRQVEALAAERGIDLDVLSLAEKDELWDEVKAR